MTDVICVDFKDTDIELYNEVRKAKFLKAENINVGITSPEEFERRKSFRVCGPPVAMKSFKNGIYKHIKSRSNLNGRLGFVIKKINDEIERVEQKKIL